MIELGIYLRERREEADLSLAKLSKQVGVSRQFLYMVEVGDARPQAHLCERLARALHLDSDVVLLLAGHTPPDVLSILQENPQAGCAILRGRLVA
jgi:DNA-binding XRE family transcriptional regulator